MTLTRWILVCHAILLGSCAGTLPSQTRPDMGVFQTGASLASYQRVLLDPVEVAFKADWQRQHPDIDGRDLTRIRARMAQLFHEELSRLLTENDGYQIVSTPAPDVLRVSASIVALDIAAPVSRAAAPTRSYLISAGEMTLLAELRDSESGAPLARIEERDNARRAPTLQLVDYGNVAEAREAFTTWAKLLRHALDQARADSPKARAVAQITGTVTYRERIALPPGAQLELSLEDIPPADVATALIARQRLVLGAGPPYPFALEYDPARIDAARRYGLRAKITTADQLFFASNDATPVLGGAGSSNISLLLSHSDNRPAAELVNTYWKLVKLGDQTITTPEGAREIHIVLRAEEHRVVGFAGCNGLMGRYSVHASKITFTDMGGTLMACASGMEQEQEFHQVFPRVASWKIVGETLQFDDAGGKPVAHFESVYLP